MPTINSYGVALPIGSNVLMGTDVPASMPVVIFGTSSSISVDADSEDEGNKLSMRSLSG